eukprot:jgi/Botrbrau1/20906/Bobra.0135s0037.1
MNQLATCRVSSFPPVGAGAWGRSPRWSAACPISKPFGRMTSHTSKGGIKAQQTFQIDHSLPDLSPKTLVDLHYSEARETWEKLSKIKRPDVPIRHSGPQGQVEPFTIIDDPSAWYAEQYQDPESYTYRFSSAEIAELESAIQYAESLSIPQEGNLLLIQNKVPTKEEFPLPTLGPVLERIREEVRVGRGFALLRGLPVDRWTRRQAVVAYWGIALYWGNVRSQNKKGHIIGHVKNINHDVLNPLTRVYATTLAQPFHIDGADIVGLMCLKTAREGGLSSWASSITAHNEMLRLGRRDLVECLALRDVWYVDRKGEVPEGAAEYFESPIFNYHDGYLSVSFSATYYELSQRHPQIPRLTDEQKEAIRVFTALVSSDLLRLDLFLEPGDLQLVYNHNLVHTRSAFTDFEDVDQRRHMVRLWVSPLEDRPLPDAYLPWDPDGKLRPGFRGGVHVSKSLTVPLEAE